MSDCGGSRCGRCPACASERAIRSQHVTIWHYALVFVEIGAVVRETRIETLPMPAEERAEEMIGPDRRSDRELYAWACMHPRFSEVARESTSIHWECDDAC